MLVKHYLTMTAKCPADGRIDHYELIVECKRVVLVEKILAESVRFQDKPLYQEEITNLLSKRLRAKVTTIGFHSGIKTVCEA